MTIREKLKISEAWTVFLGFALSKAIEKEL